MGFFDGDDATVGPGALGDGAHGFAQFVEGDVELLAAGADGAKDAASAEVAGVGVCDEDVDGEHVGLDSDVGVLPGVEAADGHIAIFGGWRDLVELLTLHVGFGALLDAGLAGDVRGGRGGVAAGKTEGKECNGEKGAGAHVE